MSQVMVMKINDELLFLNKMLEDFNLFISEKKKAKKSNALILNHNPLNNANGRPIWSKE